MEKVDVGLIIAAGKQKRFNDNEPKALVKINDKCLLDINVSILKEYCKKVYVVCSYSNKEYFSDSKYDKIIIESGYGSGDAILKAINILNISSGNIIICWGDTLLNKSLCDITCSNYKGISLVPCLYENCPYVRIVQKNNTLKIFFSKYGDIVVPGFHDMSLFLCNLEDLLNSLNKFNCLFYNKDENMYQHPHGNEFEFLDIFNDTKMKAHILEIDNKSRTYSFNTKEELSYILKELGNEN